MAWGDNIEFFRLRAEHGELDAAWQERPAIAIHLNIVWLAFLALSGDRQVGFSKGPIPFLSIDRYAQRFGIDDADEFEWFQTLIAAMDSEFLKYKPPDNS